MANAVVTFDSTRASNNQLSKPPKSSPMFPLEVSEGTELPKIKIDDEVATWMNSLP